MPGIFGVAPLDGRRPADPAELNATLDVLAAALRHNSAESVDRHVDASRGLAIGRIGLAHHHGAAWPSATPVGAAFVSGHPGGLAEGRALSGFYAAAIMDDDGVTLQADRTGSHRLFWGAWNGRVHFAPEISALLSLPGAPRDIDFGAFGTVLASRTLYRDQTLFAGLKRLCGGARLRIGAGAAQVEEYWRYVPGMGRVRKDSMRDLAMEMATLLRDSTARHYGDPASTILFLSGGKDSRALLAAALYAKGITPEQIRTVTWADSETHGASDLAIARQLAKITGVQHEFMVRDQSDFGGKFERMNTLLGGGCLMAIDHPSEHEIMERLAAKGIQRSIRGDQILTTHGSVFSIEQAWRSYKICRLRDASNAISLLHPQHRSDIVCASEQMFSDLNQRYQDMPFDAAKDSIYFDVYVQSYLGSSVCWRQLYFDERSPILDDTILDFVSETPDEFRLEKREFDTVMNALWGDRPVVPYATDHGLHYLPDLIAPGGAAEAYVVGQIEDGDSGIWAYLDQGEARRLLAGLRAKPRRQSLLKRVLREARDTLRRVDPQLTQNLSTTIKRSTTPPVGLLSSVLILKHWHDHFIAQRPLNR